MGWILEVGIERVLRGDICKSDFFLNLFWIFLWFFLVEFYSWEFSWTSGWIPEVGIERVLRSDIWGSGHLPLASTSSHLEPASVYFFQTFPQKTFWSSSSSSRAPFLFIVCISPLPNFCQPAQIMFFSSFNYFSRLFCSNQREIFGNLAQSPILNSKPKQSTLKQGKILQTQK